MVVICHGVNSHGGQYVWVGEQFASSGFAAYALDLRGRGQVGGRAVLRRGRRRLRQRRRHTIELAKSRHPGLPVFLLGHSAGGVVSCDLRAREPGRARRLDLRELRLPGVAPGFALAAIKGLSHIAPRLPVLKLKNEDFSRDPKVVEALNNDPLPRTKCSRRSTVAALVRADERLRRSSR